MLKYKKQKGGRILNKIKIITDSTWDRGKEVAKKMAVSVVPLTVTFGQDSFLDDIDITREVFIEKLRKTKELPVTSQPSPQLFEDEFKKALDAGFDVVCLTVASNLSGTYNSAFLAKESLESDRIHIIDSGSVAMGLALLVDRAVQLRDKGLGALEIVNEINELKGRLEVVASLDTLENLEKGGRISKSQSFIGGILKIKPILKIFEGVIITLGKAKGKNAAIKKMVDYLLKEGIDTDYKLAYGYVDNKDNLDAFIGELESKIGKSDNWVQGIGSVVATHAGLGAFGLAFIKKNHN